MQAPKQSLKLADDLFSRLMQQRQTSTIRFGHGRGIIPGPLEFQSLDDILVSTVLVERVIETVFGDLTEEDARKNGSASLNKLFEGMKEFYPDIMMDSPVTVIEFRCL